MKKLIFLFFVAVIMSFSVTALTVTRTLPSSAAPNSQFSLTYMVDGQGTTNYGGLIEEDISGGCKYQLDTRIRGSFFSGDNPRTYAITTPASGTCTIMGNYQYAADGQSYPEVNFPTATITISGTTPECPSGQTKCSDGVCRTTCITTCTESWTCGSWSTCSGGIQTTTCTDSNSCGTTSGKPSTSRSCTITGCTLDAECGTGKTCESGTCVAATPPPPSSTCEVYQTEDKVNGGCKMAAWVWIIVALIALFLIMRMFK